jgi:hypothetical protein
MLGLRSLLLFLLVMPCSLVRLSLAQETTNKTAPVVPALVNFSGSLADINGKPITSTVGVTLLFYREQQGGAPLWMETQNVHPDKTGHYSVMLGSTSSEGLPGDLFVSGEARWLGIQAAGLPEQPRVLLLSVPYAMKAADAETVGGLPPSAFMRVAPVLIGQPAATPSNGPVSASAAASETPSSSNVTTTGGTVNAVPLFTTATNIQKSILTQTGATAINVAGKLNLPAQGTAAATGGKFSRPEDFVASSFNSTSAIAVPQTFQLQAAPAGNNTAAPFATLDLMYGSGTATPTETGLKFNNKGLITFAAGQTFPGTGKGTITGVTAGTGLLGGGTSGIVALNLDATKVPELGSNNAFSGTEQFKGAVGVGTTPMANGYTPLSIGSANGFGTWFAIANTSAGGHTWNIISAGAGNAEGAGNFGITDLTGKSTIWLEGNTRTTSLVASGSAGASVIDADVQGANDAAYTPGLRFGGGSSGETIASTRGVGLNRFGLDFYTNFAPRVSITQSGQMGIATQVPHNQLDVLSRSNGYAAIYAGGGSAASGSGANGGDGLDTFGGDADTNSNSESLEAGNGVTGYGGAGGYFGGAGVLATGGNGNTVGGTGIAAWPGNGPDGGLAGLFGGDVVIEGTLVGGSISHLMDHPLDPANKYLSHSAVESEDMMNIYNGIVVLDSNGEALVQMPNWFSTLNRDFRYQLTCIGGFAPVYIAEELANNQFKVGGGRAGMRISWQITGIRQDAWSNAHRIPVEEQKNARERGHYLHPELYGAPAESSIEWARHPETMKRLKEMRHNRSRTLQAASQATTAKP